MSKEDEIDFIIQLFSIIVWVSVRGPVGNRWCVCICQFGESLIEGELKRYSQGVESTNDNMGLGLAKAVLC